MWVLVGGGGTSTTFSITTTALAVVVLLLVVLVPPPPTKTHIDLRKKIIKSILGGHLSSTWLNSSSSGGVCERMEHVLGYVSMHACTSYFRA